MKCLIFKSEYHERRPRLESLAVSLCDPEEEPAFLLEASPQFLLGICFVLGEISLRANKLKTFLPLTKVQTLNQTSTSKSNCTKTLISNKLKTPYIIVIHTKLP